MGHCQPRRLPGSFEAALFPRVPHERCPPSWGGTLLCVGIECGSSGDLSGEDVSVLRLGLGAYRSDAADEGMAIVVREAPDRGCPLGLHVSPGLVRRSARACTRMGLRDAFDQRDRIGAGEATREPA